MKERPILFSAPMVRALLAGTKTQTRRVLKQATGPSLSVNMADDAPGVAELSWLHGDGPGHEVHETIKRVSCPYGQPGDRLWVRETHFINDYRGAAVPEGERAHCQILYRADDAYGPDVIEDGPVPWRSPLHLPRWASRLTLEITGVRVERLQDISEADAIAEGVTGDPCDHVRRSCEEIGCCGPTAAGAYRSLWEQINGAGSWDANPFVWVVEFRRAAA